MEENWQAALREACEREREKVLREMRNKKVKNSLLMTASFPSVSGWGSIKPSGDLVKPPLSSLFKKKAPAGSEARGQEVANNSKITIVGGTVFAPAFRSPEISLSPGGRDDSFSLDPTSGTPIPTAPSHARPFCRVPDDQITSKSSAIKMSGNSVATVPRRPVPYTPTFHFAEPIAGPLIGGVQEGGENQQCLEWDQPPMALEGVELPTVPNAPNAAFGKDPLSVQMEGIQTSPKAFSIPAKPLSQDPATTSINSQTEGPSTGTSGPPCTTSAIQFRDQTALSLQPKATVSRLPPLPKTAQELLLDPADPNSDTNNESESSGVLENGDNRLHHMVGELCLTGRARKLNPGGNGDYGGWGRGSEGDRRNSYRGKWAGGAGRDRWGQNGYRPPVSNSHGNICPSQSAHETENPPSGDPGACLQCRSVATQSRDAREDLHSSSGVQLGDDGRGRGTVYDPCVAQIVASQSAGIAPVQPTGFASEQPPHQQSVDPNDVENSQNAALDSAALGDAGPSAAFDDSAFNQGCGDQQCTDLTERGIAAPELATNPLAALGGVTFDQGGGVPQDMDSQEGGSGVPDMMSNPLVEFFKGLGWQGMQIPTQSVVVHAVTTPAQHLPPLTNPTAALGMLPLPTQPNAAPPQFFAPQAPAQMQLAPPVQLNAPPLGGQPLNMPIPPRVGVLGPVPPVLHGVIRPVAQAQMPIQPNAAQSPPAQPPIPQPPRPQHQPQFNQAPFVRQQGNQQTMQAALLQALQNANIRPQLRQPRPQINPQQQIPPAQLPAQPVSYQYQQQQQIPQQQIAQLPMPQPPIRPQINQAPQHPIPAQQNNQAFLQQYQLLQQIQQTLQQMAAPMQQHQQHNQIPMAQQLPQPPVHPQQVLPVQALPAQVMQAPPPALAPAQISPNPPGYWPGNQGAQGPAFGWPPYGAPPAFGNVPYLYPYAQIPGGIAMPPTALPPQPLVPPPGPPVPPPAAPPPPVPPPNPRNPQRRQRQLNVAPDTDSDAIELPDEVEEDVGYGRAPNP